MNSTTDANNSPNVKKFEACIHQAGVDQGIAHCRDGTTNWFQDHYSRNLRATIKLVLYIFSRLRSGSSEHELDSLIRDLKLCRDLLSPDHDLVAVIEILLRNLLRSNFDQLVSMMPSRQEISDFIANLLEQVRDEGERTQAIACAMQWERESNASELAVKYAVETAFAGNAPVKSLKVALLHKTFMPADREEAYSLYERAKGNEALFRQEISGQKVRRRPDPLLRPDIALVRNDLSTLKGCFDRAISIRELLRCGVITLNFSRPHGLYLSAVLLADTRKTAALEDLTNEVDRMWDEVTDGDGHAHYWSEPQCSWSGLIEPRDTAKKTSLMLELEYRAMRDKYVRVKGAESLPTFTLIQPAAEGVQRKGDHHAER